MANKYCTHKYNKKQRPLFENCHIKSSLEMFPLIPSQFTIVPAQAEDQHINKFNVFLLKFDPGAIQ